MKRGLLFFLIGILALASVDALTISPSSFTITQSINEIKYYNLSIFANETYNNQSITIYNLSLTNIADFTFPTIGDISFNQTKNYTFSVSTSSTYSANYNAILSYLINASVREPDFIIVKIINSSSFLPNNATINQNDTLSIYNSDTINHSITEITNAWSYNIPAGSYVNLTFQNIGSVNVFDSVTLLSSWINVENKTKIKLIHDSTRDISIPISVNSVAEKTQVSLDLFVSAVTLNFDQIYQNFFKVKNTGNKTALNIKIMGEWAEIDNATILQLEPNQESSQIFRIKPNISTTAQTNQSYTKSIIVSGNNFDLVSKTYSVFVNYHSFENFSSESGTRIVFIPDVNLTIEFCKQFPEYSRCSELFRNITQEKLVERTLFPAIKESTVNETLTAVNKLDDRQQRMENKVNVLADDTKKDITSIQSNVQTTTDAQKSELRNQTDLINKLIENMNNLANQTNFFSSLEYQKRMEAEGNLKAFIFILVGAVFLVGLCGGLVFLAIKRRNSRLNMMRL